VECFSTGVAGKRKTIYIKMAEAKKKGTEKKENTEKKVKVRKKRIIIPKKKQNLPSKKIGIVRTKDARTKKKGVPNGKRKRMHAKAKEVLDPYDVILFPLSTEKGVRLMEGENKLLFVVDKRANKQDVKKAIETIFKVKVESVNMLNTVKGQKRAYIKFSFETPAIDIATDLGMI
jgi:large subunit ribosomal protein L23